MRRKIRIIGGSLRSRVIEFSDNILGLRPTPNRVRETLFNWLGQDLSGKKCLDLFAGSGALGFEALSRNAVSVVMVEKNRRVYLDLVATQKSLAVDNLELVNQDGLFYLANMCESVDLIFLDPPYNSDLLAQSLNIIQKRSIFKNTLIYIECDNLPNLVMYNIIKSGKASLVHYRLIKINR